MRGHTSSQLLILHVRTSLPPRGKLPSPPKGRTSCVLPGGGERLPEGWKLFGSLPAPASDTPTQGLGDGGEGSHSESCGIDLSEPPKHKVLSSV